MRNNNLLALVTHFVITYLVFLIFIKVSNQVFGNTKVAGVVLTVIAIFIYLYIPYVLMANLGNNILNLLSVSGIFVLIFVMTLLDLLTNYFYDGFSLLFNFSFYPLIYLMSGMINEKLLIILFSIFPSLLMWIGLTLKSGRLISLKRE